MLIVTQRQRRALTHTHAHTHTHKHTHTHTHTQTLSLSLTHTHKHTHKYYQPSTPCFQDSDIKIIHSYTQSLSTSHSLSFSRLFSAPKHTSHATVAYHKVPSKKKEQTLDSFVAHRTVPKINSRKGRGKSSIKPKSTPQNFGAHQILCPEISARKGRGKSRIKRTPHFWSISNFVPRNKRAKRTENTRAACPSTPISPPGILRGCLEKKTKEKDRMYSWMSHECFPITPVEVSCVGQIGPTSILGAYGRKKTRLMHVCSITHLYM